MAVANVAPMRSARCWTAVVKKDEESTSSQRSKLKQAVLTPAYCENERVAYVVSFQLSIT